MKRPIAIDLFSGCGGMSLGLEASGFDIVVAVEFDAIHALIHHLNFSYTHTICQDINHLNTDYLKEILQEKGIDEVDLIASGPPCQGFSLMGKRQLDDPRNSLVFEYVRVIRDLQPKYFVFENVPGIALGNHKQFLEELINEFESLGYHIAKPIKILDGSLFGAPQKRKRLILMGSRQDMQPVNYPLETEEFNNVESVINDLVFFPAFIGENKGIDANKLDYSGFRRNFTLKPQGVYGLCHDRQRDNWVYNHVSSNHTKKITTTFSEYSSRRSRKNQSFFETFTYRIM
jgi:DNA (cytosine-5)-methyltransferase 1